MNASECCFTLVEEVDGLHAGIFLIADLQLMELTEQIDQLLHHLHPILTETTHTHTHNPSVNYRFHSWPHSCIKKVPFLSTALIDQNNIWSSVPCMNTTDQSLHKIIFVDDFNAEHAMIHTRVKLLLTKGDLRVFNKAVSEKRWSYHLIPCASMCAQPLKQSLWA